MSHLTQPLNSATATQPLPRGIFFGEKNMSMLLNVVSDVHSNSGNWAHKPFDRDNSEDRTLLFRALSTTYQSHAFATPAPQLGQLNKLALREVHTQLVVRSTGTHPVSDSVANTNRFPNPISEQHQSIRDLQTHTRKNPTTFLDRPKESVGPSRDGTGENGKPANNAGTASVDSALADLEARRHADDPHRKVAPINFADSATRNGATTSTNGSAQDNSDVQQRLEELEKTRSEVLLTADGPNANANANANAKTNAKTNPTSSSSSSPAQTTQTTRVNNNNSVIVDAMAAFTAESDTMNSTVAVEECKRRTELQEQHKVFQTKLGSTVPQNPDTAALPPIAGESHNAADVIVITDPPASNEATPANHSATISQSAPSGVGVDVWSGISSPHADDGVVGQSAALTSTRFESDLELHSTTTNTPTMMPDTCAFQQSLQLDNGLDDRQLFRTQDMRENMIIKPRQNYTTNKHYLEVSSADRNRTISSDDNPYEFTVHFGSDQPGYRVVPIFDVYPTEEPEDYFEVEDDSDSEKPSAECTYNLHTSQIRSKLGLGGIPQRGQAPDISQETLCETNIEYKSLSNCSTNSRANVDTVYHNIVAIQTNYVQLYLPFQELSRIPYVLLEVSQFTNMYNSTNNTVRKSFCKLFYDRSTSPTSTSNMHVFVPLNNERKLFVTPIASIERLTFSLYTPTGHSLTHLCSSDGYGMDVFRVVHFSSRVVDGVNQLCIQVCMQDGQTSLPIQENDCVHFDCKVDWYNKDRWLSWVQSSGAGAKELDRYEKIQQEYAEKLHAHRGASVETLDKLRKEYETKQVRFSYPLGPSTTMQQKLHDYVTGPAGLLVLEVSDNMVYVSLPDTIDVDTAMDNGGTVLLYAAMYNTSNSTNISMTVWTREEEDVVMASNV